VEENAVVVAIDPVTGFQPVRVILVGLGGIGSKLADELARYMSYTSKAPKELLLIDGDVYSQGNLERQSILESDVGKSKAQAWADGLAAEFHNLSVSAMCGYVGKEGTKKDNVVPIDKISLEGSIVILGVDNHKTRNLFYLWCLVHVPSVYLISGGNNKFDGSVINLWKNNGNRLIDGFAFHPEILNPQDKNPADLSCAELAKIDGGTQVIWANGMAATVIGNEVHSIVTGEWDKLRKRGEVYFDILENVSVSRQRLVTGKEVTEPQVTKVVEKPKVTVKRVVRKTKGKKPVSAELKVVDERGSESNETLQIYPAGSSQ
jgi:molybdopterin/thiamine biosynthesis adenylyltransferase